MADEDNNEIAKEVAQNSVEPNAKNPFVTLLLLLNAVIMGGVAYFQFQSHQKANQGPELRDVVKAEMKSLKEESERQIEGGAPPVQKEGQLLRLDPFTANLAQSDGPKRYVRVTTVLKFSKESDSEEFKARQAQIRDSIISILNSKRPEDLLQIEGKKYLKEEIKASINSFFVNGFVDDVYYTSFQIN